MNEEHKQILKQNRRWIEQKILYNAELMQYFQEYKIFNKYMCQDIKSMGDIIDLLPTRGPKAFENFIHILKKANYLDEVKLLETPNLTVNVTDSSMFYKMSSNPLGYCLIINNVEFEKKSENSQNVNTYRHGSDVDAQSLRAFLEENNFEVTLVDNLNAEKMIDTIANFSEKNFYSVDSMILIILSHGGQKDNKDFVYGTDWNCIFKSDIICKYFTNDKTFLQSKPKIFIFNACRGEGMDYGVVKTLPQQSLDSNRFQDDIITILSDILIVHSSLPNHVSVLDHDEGSFFCATLVSVLKEYHKVHDFETIIKLVNSRLEKKVSQIYRVVQAAHVETQNWKRKIMLCPSNKILSHQTDTSK